MNQFTNSILLSYLLVIIFFLPNCDQDIAIQELTTPCKIGGEPNLHINKNGQAHLSWVEYLNDSTDVLAFSRLEGKRWTAPNIIAKGSNWFVNWADFPSMVAFEGNPSSLAAHWLQKSEAGTYDYDIRISLSKNGGKEWQPSFILHSDGVAAEHGFLSMVPVGANKIFATWLDGRYTKTENNSDGHDHEGQGGAMTLRGGFFDEEGKVSNELELDDRVCDCCNTSAALTKNGVIIAYRDRSEEEIRDISIVRQIGPDWTQPRSLSQDKWEIAGCPVNGPKIIADGADNVAVAWFTRAGDTAKVLIAFSEDAGANFGKPIRVDDGNPLGRVDIVYDGKKLVVSWLESKGVADAVIRLAKVQTNGTIEKRTTLSETSASRSSGFPIMEKWNNQYLFAWTSLIDEVENTTIKTAIVDF